MVAKSLPLAVVYAKSALRELDQIWDYNAKKYSPEHADAYVDFIETRIETLATEHADGKTVESNPKLRYVTIKRRKQGDGHIAVYRVVQRSKTVRILHLFHTKQDWQSKL